MLMQDFNKHTGGRMSHWQQIRHLSFVRKLDCGRSTDSLQGPCLDKTFAAQHAQFFQLFYISSGWRV